LGHGLFEEDKDFYNKVLEYCNKNSDIKI